MGLIRHLAPDQSIVIENKQTGEELTITNYNRKGVRLHLTGPANYRFYEKEDHVASPSDPCSTVDSVSTTSIATPAAIDVPAIDPACDVDPSYRKFVESLEQPKPVDIASYDADHTFTPTHVIHPHPGA